MFGFLKKKQVSPVKGRKAVRPGRAKLKGTRRHAGPYSPDQRRQAVEAYLKSGVSAKDFAKTWGTSPASLFKWQRAYREHGGKGLENRLFLKGGKKRGRKGLPEPVKQEITAVKRENPDFGIKKVRNFLWRFRGVKVSSGTVRKTFKEANIPPVQQKGKKRRRKQKPKVQRFERARAMQLWQTDITSYMLTRHSQRVYLTVFMDDHSRYIVSWALQLQQTKEFVIDTLLQGIQRFGKPEEVLTDQGRQYFSWRGKSDFRKLLSKQGIKHVVARAHHPQTVGKCERFWETVGDEFWDRVEPQDLAEARERFGHFVNHYNHFRPHQGLDGHVPADRFFGAAADVRKAIEDTISKNALRLAVGEAPRKPVYLIGQIGETPVSLHGEKGKLVLQMPDGNTKQLDYEDFGHGKEDPTKNKEGETYDKAVKSDGTDGEGSSQDAPEEAAESEVLAAEAAAISGESVMGDGELGAAGEGARVVSGLDGVLAGADHEAGAVGSAEDISASRLAAVTAGNLRYGGRVTDPTQDTGAKGGEEHGNQADGSRSRERSEGPAQADRRSGEEDESAGTDHRDFKGDAGLQRCENTHGDGVGDTVPGGDDTECKPRKGNQENDGSSTGGSSS
jgi:transposase InsO family protein/transposase-like protein